MGFFSDLKDDLSQAVNELMPEGKLDEALAENGMELEKEDPLSQVNLSDLLDKVENMSVDTRIENEMEEYPEEIHEDGYMNQIPDQSQSLIQEAVSAVTEKDNYRMAIDETAVITSGMTIRGDMSAEGSLELTGVIRGNVDVLGKLYIYGKGMIEGNSKAAEIYAEDAQIVGEVNSQGSVKVGANSVIIGNVFATSAVIAGAVKGDIDVRGPVILDASAIVMGNIKSKSVQINNGAVIEGLCSQCYAEVNPTSFFDDFKVGR